MGDQAYAKRLADNAKRSSKGTNCHVVMNGNGSTQGHGEALDHKEQSRDAPSKGHSKASNGHTTLQYPSGESAKSNGEMNGYHHLTGIKNTGGNGMMSGNGSMNGGKAINGYIFIDNV